LRILNDTQLLLLIWADKKLIKKIHLKAYFGVKGNVMSSYKLLGTPFLFSIVLAFFPSPSDACEPPWTVEEMCRHSTHLNFHKEISRKLLSFVENYDSTLRSALQQDNPKVLEREGDGSCFLMNTSIHHIKSLIEHGSKKNGKVCKNHIYWITEETKKLVSTDAPEFKYVRSKKSIQELSKIRKQVHLTLTEFENKHLQLLDRKSCKGKICGE
jgi:hypothetical protein